MAEYPLIRDYLLVVDSSIRHRPDATDLRDELADHLIEAVDRLRSRGLDSDTAERRSLQRFGDPAVVANLLNTVPSKGSPMYTVTSRTASIFAVVAAALWAAAAAALPFALGNLFAAWTEAAYLTGMLLVAGAIVTSAVVLAAVHVRLVGSVDSLSTLVTMLLVIAALGALIAGWMFVSWMGFLLVATSITLGRASGTPIGAGTPRVLLQFVWPILALAVIGLAFFVSASGIWADSALLSDAVQSAGLALVCVVYGAGILALGLRLRTVAVDSAVDRADGGPLVAA